MKQAIITLDEHGVPAHLKVDDTPPVPINAFLFLSSVPAETPMGHILVYGCSDTIGKLIYGFWMQTAEKNPDGAMVIEAVARDIVKAADAARSNKYVTGDESKEGGKFH